MGHKNFALIAGIGGAGMLALLVGLGRPGATAEQEAKHAVEMAAALEAAQN